MPVLDTEVLFALNPKDSKHSAALRILEELKKMGKRILVADAAMLEYVIVLRSIGKKPSTIRMAILAIKRIIEEVKGEEVSVMCLNLLASQCLLEERYGLTFFDSLIAASVLSLDNEVISDDDAFDKVPGVRRIPLS